MLYSYFYSISLLILQTTNFQRYNSFTLPKSSSVGQIRYKYIKKNIIYCVLYYNTILSFVVLHFRSLVEESTRSYQDNTKRNVPAGIGKKFSLSSGALLTKSNIIIFLPSI